jgi:putative spermidine/putrescine transport system permease protein
MFVLPLLIFIMLSFAPIASMLWRSVHHPTVANPIPLTHELQR